jgi:hypothetical protein
VSIPVDVADLASTLRGFGTGYLLTTRSGRVKVVSVAPRPVDRRLVVAAPGRGSVANVGDEPAVTLLWPPREAGGMSLLVDGSAEVRDEDVVVTPTSAVLHRSVDAETDL